MDSNSPAPETHNSYLLNSKIMLSAIIILFSIVLLILAVHLYVRYFIYRRANSRRRRNLLFSSSTSAAPPRSLDPAILSSLPVLIFDADDVSSETECAVCLCEFAEGEKVRVLPRCEHCFHVGCIDMWFGFHGSCPLCRTAVGDVATGKEGIDHLCTEGEGGSSMSDLDASDGDDQVSIEIEDGESPETNSNSGGNNSSRLFDSIKRLLFGRSRRVTESGDVGAVDAV